MLFPPIIRRRSSVLQTGTAAVVNLTLSICIRIGLQIFSIECCGRPLFFPVDAGLCVCWSGHGLRCVKWCFIVLIDQVRGSIVENIGFQVTEVISLLSMDGDEMPRNLLKDCTRLVTALVRVFILCCSLINFVIHAPATSLNNLSVCAVPHGRRLVKLSSEQTMIDGKAHNLDRRWYLRSSIVQTDRSIEMKRRQLFPLLNRSKVFVWSFSVR